MQLREVVADARVLRRSSGRGVGGGGEGGGGEGGGGAPWAETHRQRRAPCKGRPTSSMSSCTAVVARRRTTACAQQGLRAVQEGRAMPARRETALQASLSARHQDGALTTPASLPVEIKYHLRPGGTQGLCERRARTSRCLAYCSSQASQSGRLLGKHDRLRPQRGRHLAHTR